MRKTAIAVLILCAVAVAERAQSFIKVSHMSPNAVGISCLNNADPTGTKVGNVVIISCGK